MDVEDRIAAKRKELLGRLKAARAGRDRTKEALAAVQEAAAWVDGVVEHLQAEAHRRISDVVTRCLSLVFGDTAYQFRLTFGGKGRVGFEFVRDGQTFDADDQIGGGVLDVAAFALRLAAVTAARPKPAQVLILDEPFRFVSREYRPAVARLLAAVAEEFGFQIIQVTHAPELVAGGVVKIGGE